MGSYKPETLDAYFRTIDAMANYPNTLGFLIADHLINNTRSEISAPVITAVARDLKKYMDLKNRATGQRILPVGFGAGKYDGDLKVLNYLAAGDESSRIDFWAVCSPPPLLVLYGSFTRKLLTATVQRLPVGEKPGQRHEPPRWPCMRAVDIIPVPGMRGS